jgi:hypothetical protein
MQLNMHLTNTDKCYFYSFDPRLKGKLQSQLQSHKIELIRDDARIELILEKIHLASELKTELIKRLNES